MNNLAAIHVGMCIILKSSAERASCVRFCSYLRVSIQKHERKFEIEVRV